MPEAVGELKHGQNQFAFGRAALFHARSQGKRFYLGAVGCGVGKIRDGKLLIWLTSPAMPVSMSAGSVRRCFPMRVYLNARPYST